MEEVSFTTSDGYEIAGTLFRPAAGIKPARGAVLVAGAMGVPQTFYRALCEWLSEEGFVTMTFDYRGMGRSRRGPLRGLRADVMTWAEVDAPAAIEFLAAAAPEAPIVWLGHSLGGQIFSFAMYRLSAPTAARLRNVTYVAAGSGYWRENAWPTRRVNWLFWFVLGPLLTPLCGFWPGARLGIVGDLPAGVYWQWRRWCLNRDYAVGALPAKYRELAASVELPISAVSFTDDEMMSAKNTSDLIAIYPSRHFDAARLDPAQLGVDRVGHFGAFRRGMRDVLWRPHLLGRLARGI